MGTYIDIILTALIVTFIIDLSGIISTLKDWLGRWLGVKVGRLRPFDCSLCMTFWSGLAVALAEHSFTFPAVFFVCLCAFLTPTFKGALMLLQDTMIVLINKINEKIL